VGWLPGLRRFVDEVDEPIRLALSLHAPDDELRSRIMPVNERYPIADVVAECRRHAQATRRRVFVEYVMLAGVNDTPEQGRALAERLGRDHFKVNLIPYNPWTASAGGKAAAARPNTPPAAAGAASAGGQAAGARPNTPPSAAGGLFEGSSRERIAAFRHELERARVPVTVRLTRGRDIEAACGQLAAAPRVRRTAVRPPTAARSRT